MNTVLDLLPSKIPKDEIWLRYRFKDGDMIVILKKVYDQEKNKLVFKIIGLHIDL